MTTTATTIPAPPPMPKWAFRRVDYDQGTPDAWCAFRTSMGALEVIDGDTYRREDLVTLEAYANSTAHGDIPVMEPLIEVTSRSYNNVVFSLTLADARALAAMLTAAAGFIEANR